MKYVAYYVKQGETLKARELERPTYERARALDDAAKYLPSEDLCHAVNVAILLGLPLMLTGEPGTGKTELAASIAYQLGMPLFRFDTKTTSTASDLLYEYDAIRRFNDRNATGEKGKGEQEDVVTVTASPASVPSDPHDREKYIDYQPLGQAILLAREGVSYSVTLPDPVDPRKRLAYAAPCRSVVLIDEIDKAPRDLPNDLLREIDRMSFRVREVPDLEFAASPKYRPILILTSNSEREFPDAFVRRCAYYHIPFPGKTDLLKILTARLAPGPGDKDEKSLSDSFLDAAVRLFLRIRDLDLKKKPATAELLHWVRLLVASEISENDLKASQPVVQEARTTSGDERVRLKRVTATYVVLAKHQSDRELIVEAVHKVRLKDLAAEPAGA